MTYCEWTNKAGRVKGRSAGNENQEGKDQGRIRELKRMRVKEE